MLKIFKALASAERIAIIDLLHCPINANVTDIAAHIGLSQSATSQHLAKLRNADIVTASNVGNAVYYALHPSFIWPVRTHAT